MNDEWAYHEAKSNVERYYPVVGVLEELHKTLEVLEKKIPYFFKGVRKIYFKDFHSEYISKDIKQLKGLNKTEDNNSG